MFSSRAVTNKHHLHFSLKFLLPYLVIFDSLKPFSKTVRRLKYAQLSQSGFESGRSGEIKHLWS